MVSASLSRKQQLIQDLEAEFGSQDVDSNEADAKPVLTFRQFVDRAYPRYQWYRHSIVLADALQRVADGDLLRLMVFMPPRNGKSLLTSKLFPAYYLYRHSDRFVGINAYSAELAYTFSRSSREAFLSEKGADALKDDAATVKHWETRSGGGVWAAGIGGSVTGKGFSLGIIDDPIKNAEEALSETIKAKHRDWYGSTFYTRCEPDAAIVVVQTRWSEDDLSGFLLEQEKEDEPEHWHIINFEAIKEDSPPKFPNNCTVELDWRSAGEALNPERFPLSKLKSIARRLGTYFFNALYQQRPSPRAGGLFKRGWWQYYRVAPAQFDRVMQSWDCAFKDLKTSDFVVGQVWGKKGGEYYLLDQVRDRMDIVATIAAIRSLSAKWPQAKAKLVEDKANGPAVINLLKREISGLIAINPEGGKVVRATAISPYIEAGNVYLPDSSIAPWVHDLVEEFSAFPNGANDDQVDGCSQAIAWLEENKPFAIRSSGIRVY